MIEQRNRDVALSTLTDKVMAWRVLDMTHMRHEDARDSWRNLAEIHAAESGMDLKQYAEWAGKVHATLFKKLAAWRVLNACDFHVEIGTVADSWRNLAEIHAAESGMDLKAYAEASGKAYKALYNKVTAYRVADVSHVGIETIRDSWRNLAEIHAAPE